MNLRLRRPPKASVQGPLDRGSDFCGMNSGGYGPFTGKPISANTFDRNRDNNSAPSLKLVEKVVSVNIVCTSQKLLVITIIQLWVLLRMTPI